MDGSGLQALMTAHGNRLMEKSPTGCHTRNRRRIEYARNRENLLTLCKKKVKIKQRKCIGGVAVLVKLTPQHVEAIEKALNRGHASEATVKIEGNKVVVLQVDKKRVAV